MQDGVPRPDDRDRRSVRVDRGGVGGPIDADREPRHDRGSHRDEVRRQASRERPAAIGRPTRTDDGDGGIAAQRRRIPEHVQDVWRHLDARQADRVSRILDGQHPEAEVADPGEGRVRASGGFGDGLGDLGCDDAVRLVGPVVALRGGETLHAAGR